MGFALGQFGCLGQLVVLLLFVEVLILQVLGEYVGLCVGVDWLFADWFWPVAEGMIQRLHELSRLYSDFPLHQLLIVIFLFFALLIPFADWLGQIIFELVARLVFPSLLAAGLLPLLHALAQLSHELHLFLHPLQLLQELLHRQLGTDIEQLPAYREGAFHELLVT